MNAIYCSVNVDGIVVLLGGGGDAPTPHAVITLFALRGDGNRKTP